MQATAKGLDQIGAFDTDSHLVGMDNHASGCITHVRSDIPGKIVECNKVIKGYGGAKQFRIWRSTIHWNIEDDDGNVHKMIIPDGYYIPNGRCRLWSPQHWAQGQNKSKKHGKLDCGEITRAYSCTMFCHDKNRRFQKTIPIDPTSRNVPTFRLAAGYQDFHAYCATWHGTSSLEDEKYYDAEPFHQEKYFDAFDSTLISDDEEEFEDFLSDKDMSSGWPSPEGGEKAVGPKQTPAVNENSQSLTNSVLDEPKPEPHEFDTCGLCGPEEVLDMDTEYPDTQQPAEVSDTEKEVNLSSELLRLHYWLGHTPFAKLQEKAIRRILPKNLLRAPIPVCAACSYGKAKKRPWRSRTPKNKQVEKDLKPGHVVSVDQLVSPTPGLIAQLSGGITKQRYNYATVYVDHASGLGYVYLQKTANAEETVEGKLAFERYCRERGVNIRHYHADNGIFRAEKWLKACVNANQGPSFAAVGAHSPFQWKG